MTMAITCFRIVFRHILHTNTYISFFTTPSQSTSSLFSPRSTWQHCLLSTNSYGYKVVAKKDQRLVENNNTDAVSSTTIAAIVTSLGGPPVAVGIVRLYGPNAVPIADRVFRPVRNKWQPISHVVEYDVVMDSDGNVVDEVLAVPMLAPRLYTREDMVELQCHGSEVCLHRVLRTCLEAGATLAQPSLFVIYRFCIVNM